MMLHCALLRDLFIEINSAFNNLGINQIPIVTFLVSKGRHGVQIRKLLTIVENQINTFWEEAKRVCCILWHLKKAPNMGTPLRLHSLISPVFLPADLRPPGRSIKQKATASPPS